MPLRAISLFDAVFALLAFHTLYVDFAMLLALMLRRYFSLLMSMPPPDAVASSIFACFFFITPALIFAAAILMPRYHTPYAAMPIFTRCLFIMPLILLPMPLILRCRR